MGDVRGRCQDRDMKKNSARLIPRGTDESRHMVERVQLVMDLTSQLNVLRHSDVDGRNSLLKKSWGSHCLRPPQSTRHFMATTA